MLRATSPLRSPPRKDLAVAPSWTSPRSLPPGSFKHPGGEYVKRTGGVCRPRRLTSFGVPSPGPLARPPTLRTRSHPCAREDWPSRLWTLAGAGLEHRFSSSFSPASFCQSFPAHPPTRRCSAPCACAPAVFPLSGLRPNGEDGRSAETVTAALARAGRRLAPRPSALVGLRSSAHARRHGSRSPPTTPGLGGTMSARTVAQLRRQQLLAHRAAERIAARAPASEGRARRLTQ